jgi:hypothetical protein
MQNRLFAASLRALPAYLLAWLFSGAADAAPLKLAHRESVQIGLEMQIAGTALDEVQGILNAEVLIRDHTGEAHLAAGTSRLVFKFQRQEILRTLSFVNDGLEGEVRLLVSHDNRHWTALAADRFTVSDRQVSVNPGCAQGRFLKVEFDSRRGGTIRCLRIQGDQTDLGYRVSQPAGDMGQPVNFASGLGGGRMVYASQAADAAAGNEMMVVYDLGQPRRITEFASVHSRQPVALKVYALPALPEKEDWRGRLKFDPAQMGLASNLVAEADDTYGSGHVRIRLQREVTTRYLAMAWHGSAGLAGFKAYEVAATGAGIVAIGAPGGEPQQVLAVKAVSGPTVPGAVGSALAEEALQEAATLVAAAEPVESTKLDSALPGAAPVVQASYQPQRDWGYFAGSMGGFAPAQTGAQGTLRDKTSATGTRRLRKANEEPAEDGEPEEFEGPAFGIEWCLSPSAT